MKFIVNPENYSHTYLENLNICFPNWGKINTFDWVFSRKINNRKADLFIINSDENELLAGSAISYRKIITSNQLDFEIGIMTGSWTLPISRGMGCFSKAIEKSNEIVEANKVPFLTAFVTESNASYRRLKDAGSDLLKTNYIISQKNENKSSNVFLSKIEILEKSKDNILIYYEIRNEILKSKTHFYYTLDEFENQFINRINPTFLLKIDSEFAIVEETPTIFQLHFCSNYNIEIITNLVDWANSKQKELMFFSTEKNSQFEKNIDFKIVPGFFTILNNNIVINNIEEIVNAKSNFHIEYGDKM